MPIEAGGRAAAAPVTGIDPRDLGLYLATVVIWGTTWIAVKWQVGPVAPEVSLMWRFLIAAPLMMLLARLFGLPLGFSVRTHLRFALMGGLMFSLNFVLFYHAAAYVVSGLLGVIFSLAAILNLVLAALVFGMRPSVRAAAGALLGVAGVALLFAREGLLAGHGADALAGLLLGGLGTLCFCLGNMISAGLGRDRVPVAAASAWAMTYGVLLTALVVLIFGHPLAIEETPRYLGALFYLAGPGTVLVFWLYLTLLGRVGPGPAAYTTVVSPVLALVASSAFEGYRWTPLALLGLALVAAGNVLVLTGSRQRGAASERRP